ncbi:MAG: hypothetical protein K9M99_00160 [Candidatus Cloacimonetes bacterium]|nr:hypothetical protein [Candidatus Cloacimonadota bacterium]
MFNEQDIVIETSTSEYTGGYDDDGDGCIDEDPAGIAFPFRSSNKLPVVFAGFGENYLYNFQPYAFEPVLENSEIWFPLSFMDLSEDPSNGYYSYTREYDDDCDGLVDEDGFPLSEQDFMAYYYDYSPFGTGGQRDYGSGSMQSEHYPLNIAVRQISYQWSYDYIKNQVYVEFDITNMNFSGTHSDTLFDCAAGIYIDAEVGPQDWNEENVV